MNYIKSLKDKLTTLNISPQKFFLVSALMFGVAYALLTPLFQGPDEPNHFLAISRYSNGYPTPIIENNKIGIRTNSGVVDLFYRFPNLTNGTTYSYSTQIPSLLKINLGKFRSQFVGMPASTYLPFSYSQYIVTFTIGALLNVNPYILLILMRIVGLLVWIFLTYTAIKIIPKGKWFLAVYALLPMSLFISSIISADNITNGLVYLVIAMIFNGLLNSKVLTKKYIITLFLLTILLGITKQTFFVVTLLLFALANPKFISRKKYYLLTTLTFLVTMILSLGWQAYINKYNISPIQGVNPSEQLRNIIFHPYYYFKVLWRTYLTSYSTPLYIGFIGVLGWLDTTFPIWIIFGWLIMIYKSAGQTVAHTRNRLKIGQKILFILVPVMLAGMLTTALYLSWTPLKAGVVEGLQGRYFLPILVILIPLVFFQRTEPTKKSILFIVSTVGVLQIATLAVFIVRYF